MGGGGCHVQRKGTGNSTKWSHTKNMPRCCFRGDRHRGMQANGGTLTAQEVENLRRDLKIGAASKEKWPPLLQIIPYRGRALKESSGKIRR